MPKVFKNEKTSYPSFFGSFIMSAFIAKPCSIIPNKMGLETTSFGRGQ